MNAHHQSAFLIAAVALLTGCVVGPTAERVAIESGATQPGDSDYARSRALQLTGAAKGRSPRA